MAMPKNAASRGSSMTRRQFVYLSAAAVGAATLPGCVRPAPRKLTSTDKLRIASVGCGGKGASDIQHCSKEEIVALCDADENMAAEGRRKMPNGKFYSDWGEVVGKERK